MSGMPAFIGKEGEITEKTINNFAHLMAFLGVEIDFDLLEIALENGSILSLAEASHLMHAAVR